MNNLLPNKKTVDLKIQIIVFILLLSISGFSQLNEGKNPGYMGRHIIIAGETNVSGSFYFMNKYWIKYGIKTELIINRGLSVGLSYMHNSTNVTDQTYSDNCYDYNHYTFNTHQYAVDLNIYPSEFAPLGYYFGFRFAYLRNYSNDFYKNGVLKKGLDPYSCRGYLSDKFTSNNIAMSVFFGKKRIFYNRLVVSYGFQMGLTLNNPLTTFLFDDVNPYPYETTNYEHDKLFAVTSTKENFFSTIINFKVDVGIIW